jgi:hypothetical protein
MKKFLILIILLIWISLSGCVDTVEIIFLKNDLNQTRQVIIKSKRGITFEAARLYGKGPNDPNVLLVKVKAVYPNSDAEKVGIKVGDEVIEVNDIVPYLAHDVIDPFFVSKDGTTEGGLEDVQVKFKMKRGQYIYTVTLKSL